MKSKALKASLSIAAVLLVLAISYIITLNSNISSLEQDNVLLQEAYDQDKALLESELSNLSQENMVLNEYLGELNISYSELDISYTELSQELQDLQAEVDTVIERIESYEQELQDSMQWFNDNSDLSILDSDYAIKRYLQTNCLMQSHGRCRIKTGCLFLINTEKMDLFYKYDIYTSNEMDKLQSLSEFVENDGGDCEDFSLFYKAEFNYLLELCEDVDPTEIYIESWTGAKYEYHKYALDFSRTWFVAGAEEYDLKEGYIYPNVVCGILPVPSGGASGHCVIAFTSDRIMSEDDLVLFDQAPMIEPQTGNYLGLINDESSQVYLLSKEYFEESEEGMYKPYIYEIITDDDLFLFSIDDLEWMSYSGFYEELSEKEQELQNLI